ncbi:hypothetical protein B9479_007831 [Cryptococcus floricola]|uniref:Uncharacterized protein n=1 Tax=Cryptococcus floricola TaxID=2591691 RepID=A0A5D3AKW2_9TREE|nr:hypothetical protein B9479_007831 [Cryptococcus floricola]
MLVSSAPDTNPPMQLSQLSNTDTGYQPEAPPTIPEVTRDQGEASYLLVTVVIAVDVTVGAVDL